MKILIADKFQPWGIDKLKAAGCEVLSQPGVVGPAMVDAVARCISAGVSHQGQE